MVMRILPIGSVRSTVLVSLGLALFMLGTNYCLVGVMSPSGRMACMSRSDAVAATASHCSRDAESTGQKDSSHSTRTAPCCISLTPVMAPEVGKVPPAVIAMLPVPADAPLVAPPAAGSGELLRAPPLQVFPPLSSGAPASPRAPPIV